MIIELEFEPQVTPWEVSHHVMSNWFRVQTLLLHTAKAKKSSIHSRTFPSGVLIITSPYNFVRRNLSHSGDSVKVLRGLRKKSLPSTFLLGKKWRGAAWFIDNGGLMPWVDERMETWKRAVYRTDPDIAEDTLFLTVNTITTTGTLLVIPSSKFPLYLFHCFSKVGSPFPVLYYIFLRTKVLDWGCFGNWYAAVFCWVLALMLTVTKSQTAQYLKVARRLLTSVCICVSCRFIL